MHVDVIPDRKVLCESVVEVRIGMLDASKGLVRKHNPESKRVVGGVSLPDLDLVFRVQKLDQRGEIKPRRPAADDRDPECPLRGPQPPSRRRNRCSFPVGVRGNASTNSIARGYLYGAIWPLTKSCNVFAGSRPSSAPAWTTTTALTIIPRSSSGTPITAASATAGCRRRASSTSGPAML